MLLMMIFMVGAKWKSSKRLNSCSSLVPLRIKFAGKVSTKLNYGKFLGQGDF